MRFSKATLRDSTLHEGLKVELDNTGLPQVFPEPGAFTFHVTDQSGNLWYLRCLKSNPGGIFARLAALNSYLKQHPLPCIAITEYGAHGIYVNGTWYPTLKVQRGMDCTLEDYIQQNAADSTLMSQLEKWFLDLVEALEKAHAAHGNLQHKTINIREDRLEAHWLRRHVHSAIYRVRIHNRRSFNYQHPGRSGHPRICYNARLDRFSIIVIYITLEAIRLQHELWPKYHQNSRLAAPWPRAVIFLKPKQISRLLQELRTYS